MENIIVGVIVLIACLSILKIYSKKSKTGSCDCAGKCHECPYLKPKDQDDNDNHQTRNIESN